MGHVCRQPDRATRESPFHSLTWLPQRLRLDCPATPTRPQRVQRNTWRPGWWSPATFEDLHRLQSILCITNWTQLHWILLGPHLVLFLCQWKSDKISILGSKEPFWSILTGSWLRARLLCIIFQKLYPAVGRECVVNLENTQAEHVLKWSMVTPEREKSNSWLS